VAPENSCREANAADMMACRKPDAGVYGNFLVEKLAASEGTPSEGFL